MSEAYQLLCVPQAMIDAAPLGDQADIVSHTGPGEEEREEHAIGHAPAPMVGDLVKFVRLAPSKESLVGALREAGLV